MKLTPLDIRSKEFRRSVRGYLDEDVDVFLDAVADEFERLTTSNMELQEKVKGLDEEISGHARMRETLEKTLVAAQMQSDEMRNNAQKESQSMLREAEAKAKAVVDEFYAQTQAVQQTLMQVKLLEEDFRFKFKAMLEGYLKLIEDGPLIFKGLENDVTLSHALETEEPPTPPAQEHASAQPEDLTVETSSLESAGEADNPTQEVEGAQSDTGSGGVYFGKKYDEPDDPFPEIGGHASKPRDFAW